MCLLQTIIKNTLHLQPRVATRPIKVLKVGYFSNVTNCFVSSLYPKQYERDIQYKQSLPQPYVGEVKNHPNLQNAYIEVGFHSYRYLPEHYQYRMDILGWLSDNSGPIMVDVIAVFEIPKGAIYYTDNDNHYVSDSIIFRKALFNPKEWETENFQPEKVL